MPSPVEQRVSSKIRRTVRNGEAIYEKEYVLNDWDNDAAVIYHRAQQEIELLRQLAVSNRFGGRLGVVSVAAADPEAATIATHEIAGMSLGQFVLEDENVATNLTPWFLAGRWLRQFQSLRLPNDMTETVSKRDPTDIVDYCGLRLDSLLEFGYSWPHSRLKTALLKKIECLRDHCDDTSKVWVHADYAPGNLMWDGRTLTPIDFAMVRSGQPLEDATYLIHRIEMHLVYRPWLRLPVAAIRRAILRGLGLPTADQSAAYQMLMLKHQICRLHTYVRRPASSFKQALHDRWVRTVLRRRLLQAVKNTLK